MEYATRAYLSEMAQNVRDKSYVRVYLGIINRKAQGLAEITSDFIGDEAGLYDDGISAGVTSSESDGHITFEFGGSDEIDLRGLTLTFLGDAPDEVTVSNGVISLPYSTAGAEKVELEGLFNNCSYITITPDSGQLALTKILFGIGIQFGNTDIISTQRSNIIKHLNDDLPVKRFTFTVQNYHGQWNKDNPASNARYLQEQQEVEWDYQRELEDGSLYTIAGGKVLLNTWSSDDTVAKFSCVGYLDYMEGTFYKGQYYPNGISLYELAEQVFEDAGVTKYHIDRQLMKTKVHNPLPVAPHKTCLQLIANAGRAILYEDRDGYISIRPADRPAAMADAECLYGTPFSDGGAVVNPSTSDNYVSTEPGYVKVGENFSFPPEDIEDGPYIPIGYVSHEYANANGGFSKNPQINVMMQSAFKLSQIVLNCKVPPKNLMARMTLEDEEVYKVFLDNTEETPVFSFEPILCDKIEIIFVTTTPYQRIHVNNIELNGEIQYTITYRNLYEDTPLAASLDKIESINVHTYDYALGEDSSAVADVLEGVNLIQFDEAYGEYTVKYIDNEEIIPIVESGAYYVLANAPRAGRAVIQAKVYTIVDKVITTNLQEEGINVDSKNPLISTEDLAMACEQWMESYYTNDVEYELNFRGDPIIDADDVMYLENHFVDDNLIRIEAENLSTSQGMECSNRVIARRISYSVVPVVGTAVVGYFKAV